jgi:RNA polymerase sporulation-specific sigma factor
MKYTQEDIDNNMGLVYMVARKTMHLMDSGMIEFDDLISAGVIGLIHALDRFDPDRGFKFSSYAVRCIRGYMFHEHRTLHMEQWKAMNSRYDVPSKKISLFRPFLDDGEVKEVVGCDDRGMSASALFETVNNKMVWEHVLPRLSPRQQQILQLLLSVEETNQTEIAEMLGVSRQCVSQTLLRAISHAKRIFDVREAA